MDTSPNDELGAAAPPDPIGAEVPEAATPGEADVDADGMTRHVSIVEFYRRITQRPDIREILRRLAE
jgi:hypothetical protein